MGIVVLHFLVVN